MTFNCISLVAYTLLLKRTAKKSLNFIVLTMVVLVEGILHAAVHGVAKSQTTEQLT